MKQVRATVVLLKKYLAQARHAPKREAAFLAVPVLMIVFLAILGAVVRPNSRMGKVERSPPAYAADTILRCSQDTAISQPCVSVLYNFAGHPAVEELMATVASLNPHIPASEIVGIIGRNDSDVNEYFIANENKVLAAYVFTFDETVFPNTLPGGMVNTPPLNSPTFDYGGGGVFNPRFNELYKLQVNSTALADPVCSISDPLQFYKCGAPARDVAAPMIRALAVAVMRYWAARLPGGGAALAGEATIDTLLVPFAHPVIEVDSLLDAAAPIWWMFATLFPVVFMVADIVSERQAKIRYNLSLMGVPDSSYWLAMWLWFVPKMLLANFMVVTTMALCQFNIVLKNSGGVIIFTQFFSSIAQVSLGMFISTQFNAVKPARSIAVSLVIFFSLFSNLTSLVSNESSLTSKSLGNLLVLVPPLAFLKAVTDLSTASLGQAVDGVAWSQRASSTTRFSFSDIWGWLVFDALAWLAMAIYADAVLPNAVGVRRRAPYYFLLPSYWGLTRCSPGEADRRSLDAMRPPQPQPATEPLDEDVSAEFGEVRANAYADRPGVVLRSLRRTFRSIVKCWKRPLVALDNLSLAVPARTMLCLLGPSGAGKSVVLQLLAGAASATSGDAFVAGRSVTHETDGVRTSCGFCPQFNMVWQDLTAAENIAFVAALRGVPDPAVPGEVAARLTEAKLESSRNQLVASFSTAMRRRLAIALSLVGDPAIVLLDQPTAGLDPIARREVWELVLGAKARPERTVVLATDCIEEAEALGDRVAVLAAGRLRCIGSAPRLKAKYGTGYRARVAVDAPRQDDARAALQASFPSLALAPAEREDELVLVVPPDQTAVLAALWLALQRFVEQGLIRDYQVGLASLEDVFLRTVPSEAEPAAAPAAAAPAAAPAASEAALAAESAPLDAPLHRAPAASGRGASFGRQVRALLYKTYDTQKRKRSANCYSILTPVAMLLFLVSLQALLFNRATVKQAVADPGSTPIVFIPSTFPFSFVLANSLATSEGMQLLSGFQANLPFNSSHFVQLDSLGAAQRQLFGSWYRAATPFGNFTGGMDVLAAQTVRGLTTPLSARLAVLFNESAGAEYGTVPALVHYATQAMLRAALNVSYNMALSDSPRQARRTRVDIVALVAPFVFPVILFLDFPLLVGLIMYDKEKRLLHLMRQSGLGMPVYWLATLAFGVWHYVLIAGVMLGVGIGFRFTIFIINTPGTYVLLLLFFGYAMLPMATFFTMLFAHEFAASTLSYIILIISSVVGNALIPSLQDSPSQLLLASLYPYFAMQHGFVLLGRAALRGQSLKHSDLAVPYSMLLLSGTIFLLLTLYLSALFPVGLGKRRHPCFCLMLARWRGKESASADVELFDVSAVAAGEYEDDDVGAERFRVQSLTSLGGDDAVLVLRNAVKAYGTSAGAAVRGLSFAVQRGEVFCLVGHNGCGKSTVLALLSGLCSPTQGDVYVDGCSMRVRAQVVSAQRRLGICPQADLLWDGLTVPEHLRFYGRLRGLRGRALREAVFGVARRLCLVRYGTSMVGKLPREARRRLSLGTALIGAPPIVLLDEPTAGLGHEARQQVWGVLREMIASSGLTVLLVTTSMDEAEALATRVAVMGGGTLRALGPVPHLKAKFASGYRLSVDVRPHTSGDEAVDFVRSIEPRAVLLPHSLGLVRHFNVPSDGLDVAALLAALQDGAHAAHVLAWALVQPTLEDAVLTIAGSAHGAGHYATDAYATGAAS